MANTGIKARLDALAASASSADKTAAAHTLRAGLAAKSSAIVAQAADLVRKFKADELVSELREAFDRFMGGGLPSDKLCLAKTAIVKALHDLGSNQPGIFHAAMALYWPERRNDDRRDEAADLRVAAATAQAGLGSGFELEQIVDLLADPVADVRHIAVQALISMGGRPGLLLLRLKALIGDVNAGVMEKCFDGLLEAGKADYVPFIARFLSNRDEQLQVAGVNALGQCRLAAALDALMKCWRQTWNEQLRRDLLSAVALHRNERAFEFLIGLIAEGDAGAEQAIDALGIYRMDSQIRGRVAEAVEKARGAELRRAFAKSFPA